MADEKIKRLKELIRLASTHLLTKEDKYGYITRPELKDRLYGEHPECFISLKRMGRDTSTYTLPLCNRSGMVDPDVIAVSVKVVQRMLADPSGMYDVNELQGILDKLDRLKARYKKDIPKPPKAAGRKAVVTRMFNNIKNHLVITRKQ